MTALLEHFSLAHQPFPRVAPEGAILRHKGLECPTSSPFPHRVASRKDPTEIRRTLPAFSKDGQ